MPKISRPRTPEYRLGTFIQNKRREANLGQVAVAAAMTKAGIPTSQQRVCNFERTRGFLMASELIVLSQILDFDLNEVKDLLV